jgi:isoleucyl-tRNA synthetase
VDKAGIMRSGLPEYEGKRVFDANAPIVELLKTRGALMHTEKMEHSYPHCWRCHNPVIFRATEQWFIGMDTPMKSGVNGETMRSRTLAEIAKVKWDPAWGEERISNMIATRPDWCISRQRVSMRQLWQACERSARQPEGGAVRFATRRRCLVYARGRCNSPVRP